MTKSYFGFVTYSSSGGLAEEHSKERCFVQNAEEDDSEPCFSKRLTSLLRLGTLVETLVVEKHHPCPHSRGPRYDDVVKSNRVVSSVGLGEHNQRLKAQVSIPSSSFQSFFASSRQKTRVFVPLLALTLKSSVVAFTGMMLCVKFTL